MPCSKPNLTGSRSENEAHLLYGGSVRIVLLQATIWLARFSRDKLRREMTADGTSGWDDVFYPAVDTLTSLGIVERVGMLLDGDDPEAEIVHPYGMQGGEPAERELARTAHEAAAAMMTEDRLWRAEMEGYPHLVPVQKHIANATLVEVFRLKYRPHTKATGAWYAQMKESTAEYLPRYKAIIRDRAAASSAA